MYEKMFFETHYENQHMEGGKLHPFLSEVEAWDAKIIFSDKWES